MGIDQISKLMNLSGLQGVQGTSGNNSSVSGSNSGVSTDSSFATKLKELTQNTTTADPTKTVNSTTTNDALVNSVTGQNTDSSTSGLDGLSLQPQQLLQMMQLLSSSSSDSSSNSLLSSDSSDDDSDDSSTDAISSSSNSGTDMSQLIQAMIENQNQSTTPSDANSLGSLSPSAQTNTVNTQSNDASNS